MWDIGFTGSLDLCHPPLNFCLYLSISLQISSFDHIKAGSNIVRYLMKQFFAVLLCLLIPTYAFADNSFKVVYDGGSIQNVKAGADVKLVIDPAQIRIVRGKEELVTIPAASVTEISYGQDVHRRVGAAVGVAIFTLGVGALLALSKSKKHFIGLTWANGTVKGGFAMQCDKNDYRGILAALEGITGKKSVDSEAMTVKN
jgi:hypothetical protein